MALALRTDQEYVQQEIIVERPDGSRRTVLAHASAFHDELGNVAGAVNVLVDVTERKEAEEKLRQREEHLRAVVETTPACIKVVARDGTLLDMNSAGLAMVDAACLDSVRGQSVYGLICDEYRDAYREFNERVCRGERGSLEFEIVGLRGTRRYMETHAVPLRWGAGFVQLAITHDITDRKQADEALRESEERFRATFDRAAVGVAHVGMDQRTLWVNPGLCAMLGYTEAEMLERTVLDLTHPEDLDADLVLARRLLAGELPSYRIEKRYLHKTGSVVWGDVAVSMVRDGEGKLKYAVGVVVDITERKQAEKALKEADRRKDEFLATLAHELRNPLAPVRNALHVMKMPGASGPVVGQARDMAVRQVQHMARLLDDLLDVSRISRGKIELRKEVLDVTAAVNGSVEAVRPLFEERQHQLTVLLPEHSLRVEADSTRLEQVLTNLLNNAAKYTDAGGQVRLTAERDGGEVVLRVRDTGIGIAPEMLPKIFDLFVQADRRMDRSQGGVGIGLTLVKKLVELHGGRVAAHSRGLGQGSEFVVRLPATSDPAEPGGGEAGNGESARLARCRVLVVDDNLDAADSLGLMLQLGGQQVRVAYDGPTALLVAQAFGPQVVFLDIGMPGMDGYEVAGRLRRLPKGEATLLVALTGWGQDTDRRRSAEAGFDHHLVKPVEPAALQTLLASLPTRR